MLVFASCSPASCCPTWNDLNFKMNNQEFNTSKPVSEQDSQTGSSEAESPVSGSEPRQRSSSSQPENFDSPSFSSSENENGVAENEADEKNSEDEPESTAISLSVPDITYRLTGLMELLFADEQRTFLRVLLASAFRRIAGHKLFFWAESVIGRKLGCRFWHAMLYRTSFVITHRERIFLEGFFRHPPYGIPNAIVNLFNFTDSPLLGPRPSAQSIEALEMALAQILLKISVGIIMRMLLGWNNKVTSRTSDDFDETLDLLHSHFSSSRFQNWLERFVTHIRSPYEIPRTSESDAASSELRDSQPSPSASQNGVHESQIEQKQIESGEDCYDTESLVSKDTLKDGSSNETQSPEMELKCEMSANYPNLDEDLSAPETLDRECANPLHETPNVPPEETLPESPEGTPSKKSKNDLK